MRKSSAGVAPSSKKYTINEIVFMRYSSNILGVGVEKKSLCAALK